MSKHSDSKGESDKQQHEDNYRTKEAIHERDHQQCTNCLTSRNAADTFDVDHHVPRGVGGSELYRNKGTLCRRCHDAKHGNGIAPTVQFQSTGQMTDEEFILFRQFLKKMLPALAHEYGVTIQPKFNLDGNEAWHCPLGDIRRLDRQLNETVDPYRSLQASEWM
jgi:hypothetical protein